MTDVADLDPRTRRSQARIIEATIDLIADFGPRGVTADAVAERSGVAKSTIYRHWSSVDDLLIDVFRRTVPPPVPLDPTASFEQCLRTQVHAVITEVTTTNWAHTLPQLLAMGRVNPALQELIDQDRDAKRDRLRTLLDQGEQEGRIPAGLDLDLVVAMLLGPIIMCATIGETERLSEIAEFTIERFLDSYRP